MDHEINESTVPTSARLTRHEYERLSKMAELLKNSFSDVLRAGLAKMWAEYGSAAEELAEAHAEIAATVRQEVDGEE